MSDEPEPIRFYRASERPFGVFSNLYRRPMAFDGEGYPHAEAAYQASKAREPAVRAWMLAAPKPHLLAMAAHGLLSWDIAPGWSAGRRDRMRRVVEAKFRQHDDLAAILLGTGEARIVEAGTVDDEVNRRWGEVKRGGQWVGTNWLGLILMEVRDALRAEGAARRAAMECEVAVLRAFAETRGVALAERAGERIDGDTMGFRMKCKLTEAPICPEAGT